MKKKIFIGIKGMHCNSCTKIIKEKLLKLDGVEKAKVSYIDEKAEITFEPETISLNKIEETLNKLGYGIKEGSNEKSRWERDGKKSLSTLKQGIVYGLVPHIGCIGFIVASVLGATIAVEFFKPFLMNPWFFHILVLISIGFATISSIFYLRKQGLLSRRGVLRKKKYLATMYGITVGINLILFLAVFPMLANLDTGSFAETSAGGVALAGGDSGQLATGNSLIRLQVDIPCPGHAPLISGELKTIEGITGVRFDFPNYFDVAYDSGQTSKAEMLALKVFETYKPNVISESEAIDSGTASLQETKEVESELAESSGSCGGSCGGSSCSGSTGGGCGCSR